MQQALYAKGLIVTGPQKSGKTTNARAIARHFGLFSIEDGWEPRRGAPVKAGTLYLTNEPAEVLASLGFRRVMSIGEALRHLSNGEARA